MKKFKVHIGRNVTGVFETPDGKIVRTPVEFICLETSIPLVESRLRMRSITDFSIEEIIKNDSI